MKMGNQGDHGLRITSLPALNSHAEVQAQQQLHETPSISSTFSPNNPQLIESWEAGLKSSCPSLAQNLKPNRGRPNRSLGRITSISIFFVTIYSTLLSGLWLAVAIKKPSWDNFIHSSTFTPTNVSTLATAFAKTIELAFLTSVIAMVGQYLTSKASNDNTSGISLAEVQLKVLLVQPGMFITRWRTYSRPILSVLGIMSLAACLSAMLYTTASDALVSPKLGTLTEVTTIQGEVQTSPANKDYIKKDCPDDDEDQCLIVEQDALAFNNFIQYLADWQKMPASSVPVNASNRLLPTAVFNGNVTVHGSWVDAIDMTNASQLYNRVITNVSMVMPHPGVIAAATLMKNNFPQAGDPDASLDLDIDAQTILPMLNVLCAEATESELLPLSYNNWTNHNVTSSNNLNISSTWRNSTALDPIFGFQDNSPPPVFWRLPAIKNSILNGNWNAMKAVYLLLAFAGQNQTTDYNFCSLSMSFRGGCSSELSVSASSSTLKSNCAAHDMSYDQPLHSDQYNPSTSWPLFAYQWAEAVALDSGKGSPNAAAPALLAELALQGPTFDPKRPLLVEALAVLAGNTLLDSMVDAPFNGSWPYNQPSLPTPVLQPIKARVIRSAYSSGGAASWENVFMLVLTMTFILSLFCLGFLLYISTNCSRLSGRAGLAGSGLREDCTDLDELFQIVLNSPQPGEGSPACDAKAKGGLANTKWHFRESAGATNKDGLDGLRVAFDGDEELANSPKNGYFSTLAPLHSDNGYKGFERLAVDEVDLA